MQCHRAMGDYLDLYMGKWIISLDLTFWAVLAICCHDAKCIMLKQTLHFVVNSVETEDRRIKTRIILFFV